MKENNDFKKEVLEFVEKLDISDDEKEKLMKHYTKAWNLLPKEVDTKCLKR